MASQMTHKMTFRVGQAVKKLAQATSVFHISEAIWDGNFEWYRTEEGGLRWHKAEELIAWDVVNDRPEV